MTGATSMDVAACESELSASLRMFTLGPMGKYPNWLKCALEHGSVTRVTIASLVLTLECPWFMRGNVVARTERGRYNNGNIESSFPNSTRLIPDTC